MVAPDFSRATFAAQGKDTLAFYTKFANPASPYYTWSDNFKNSIDGFADGSISMMLNYAYQIPNIKAKNPFLNFGVAPLPQLALATKKVSYSNYWGLAVSNRSKNPKASWNFLLGLTTNPQVVRTYTTATKRVPALKSLLGSVSKDPELGPFANQVLQARSWPEIDSLAVDTALSTMIDTVVKGEKSMENALKQAEETISSLMAEKKRQF